MIGNAPHILWHNIRLKYDAYYTIMRTQASANLHSKLKFFQDLKGKEKHFYHEKKQHNLFNQYRGRSERCFAGI